MDSALRASLRLSNIAPGDVVSPFNPSYGADPDRNPGAFHASLTRDAG